MSSIDWVLPIFFAHFLLLFFLRPLHFVCLNPYSIFIPCLFPWWHFLLNFHAFVFQSFFFLKHISNEFSYQLIFQVIFFILPFIYFCNVYHSFFFLLLITIFLCFHDLLHHHLFSEEYLLSFCFSFPCPLVYT